MKKFAKIFVVCMLLLALTFSFASCGIFGLDLDDIEERLEDKDYDVQSYSYGGYTYLYAESDDDEIFYAIEYDDEDDAEEDYEDFLDDWDDTKEDAEEEGYNKLTYGKKGNVIYYGTVQGVKDALGFPMSLFVFKK